VNSVEFVDRLAAATFSEKPTVPEVMPFVWLFRDLSDARNGAGGSLHIVLQDPNYKDYHVQSCVDFAAKRGDRPGEELGKILLRMSQTQRRKLGDRFNDNPRQAEEWMSRRIEQKLGIQEP